MKPVPEDLRSDVNVLLTQKQDDGYVINDIKLFARLKVALAHHKLPISFRGIT